MKPRTADNQAKAGEQVAFTCAACHHDQGDPLYKGPRPHAPDNECLECWAEFWAEAEAAIRREGDWSPAVEAAFAVARGKTRQEAAELVGVHRVTLWRWLRKIRANPSLIPDHIRNLVVVRKRLGLEAVK